MKNTLLAVCAAVVLLPFTGCLVAEGHGHGHARYETRTEVIVERPAVVERPVIVVAPPRPTVVLRPPEIIIH